MVSLVKISMGQFTREAIYHSMNDRGVYLPDDYNSDLPPAQVGHFKEYAVCNHQIKLVESLCPNTIRFCHFSEKTK